MQDQVVVKQTGEVEPYSEDKVRRSMSRVGVPDSLQPEILAHLKEKFSDGKISTDEIFKYVLEYLEPRDRKASVKFNLRDAVYGLGPTGFPFEKYLAEIFREIGYKVETDIMMRGDCVTHEIDLLIEKGGHREIVEAKFHNHHDVKTDVQTALYTYARFLDVKEKNDISNVWLITNTKLTSDAISYANCKGIVAIGWNYPDKGNLQDFIEEHHMYPITILSVLSNQEKNRLIEKNIVLCSDFLTKSNEELSDPLIKKESLDKAREDAQLVCPIPNR